MDTKDLTEGEMLVESAGTQCVLAIDPVNLEDAGTAEYPIVVLHSHE